MTEVSSLMTFYKFWLFTWGRDTVGLKLVWAVFFSSSFFCYCSWSRPCIWVWLATSEITLLSVWLLIMRLGVAECLSETCVDLWFDKKSYWEAFRTFLNFFGIYRYDAVDLIVSKGSLLIFWTLFILLRLISLVFIL